MSHLILFGHVVCKTYRVYGDSRKTSEALRILYVFVLLIKITQSNTKVLFKESHFFFIFVLFFLYEESMENHLSNEN